MAFGNNKGFGPNPEPMIFIAIIAIIAAIVIPVFINARKSNLINTICAELEKRIQAVPSAGETASGNKEGEKGKPAETETGSKPQPAEEEGNSLVPLIAVEDEIVSITGFETGCPEPGETQSIGMGQEAVFSGDHLDITNGASGIAKYVIWPFFAGVFFIAALMLFITWIKSDNKKAGVSPLCIGIGIFMTISLVILFVMFKVDKMSISAAGLQESKAGLLHDFEPEGGILKVEGAALTDSMNMLVLFYYDKEGKLAGKVLNARQNSNLEDLAPAAAGINGLLPDTPLKRILISDAVNNYKAGDDGE